MASFPFYLQKHIDNAVSWAARDAFGESMTPDVKPADPRFGDFQANGALAHSRKVGRNPREIANSILANLDLSSSLGNDWGNASIAGPGFINFQFSSEFLLRWLQHYGTSDDLRQASLTFHAGRKVIVDYSAPNTAKQMHVGHIRSTVIGEAVARMLMFSGASVIRDNHIGDWGTQFGILIMAIKETETALDNLGDDPLVALEELYRKGTALANEHPELRDRARQELVLLQTGDPQANTIWERIRHISYTAAQGIYDLLGIKFDLVQGESFYRNHVDQVCSELQRANIANENEGALVVFHPEHPRFNTQPFIVRKSDGASNYATTDLATVLHRVSDLNADAILYVVDARQSDHFEQLFLTVRKWFEATDRPVPEMRHLSFGTILGEDGKAIKTRSGKPVTFRSLLDEAIDRAFTIVGEKNPDLPDEERHRIARIVGVGAVRYADLSQNRTSDYTFSWDRMLSLEGNTAPYLLYAVARIHSVFRRADLKPGEGEAAASPFETTAEMTLARKLIQFPTALEQSISDLRPHLLCTYLFELAGAFSTFYNSDKVIGEAPDVSARRLLLCSRTLVTMETGLNLLGLETLERM